MKQAKLISVRPRWVALSFTLVALVLSVALWSLVRMSDQRRLAQIGPGKIHVDSIRLQALLKSMEAGGSVRQIKVASESLKQDVVGLERSGHVDKYDPFQPSFDAFFRAAKRETSAIANGDLKKARDLDKQLTTPAYSRLEQAIESLELRTRQEADNWLLTSLVLTLVSGFAVAVGAVIIFTRHENKLTAHFELEAEEKRAETLAHHAFHDQLTGLPNRSLFMERLAHRLESDRRDPRPFAIFFIDLDNFKLVNDSLGHAAGDTLLQAVANRLSEIFRPADTVARLGGDEFTVLVDDVGTADGVIEAAQRIQQSLDIPLFIGNREVFSSASIGIAIRSDMLSGAPAMLRAADTAMYVAKRQGKCGYAVFNREMEGVAIVRLELESELRVAIQNNRLSLHFQSIVDIKSGEIREVEALLRWQHPSRGNISPAVFIPIAEETGVIRSIGSWVLRDACRQLYRWQQEFWCDQNFIVSVNVSGYQLEQPDFVQQVRSCLTEFQIDPRRLKLEVTETAMLKDLDRAILVFDELRRLGVRIAIDDFGTGFSSISYLSRLPVDTLKIDRTFVTDLANDPRLAVVVTAMISMAKTLGLQVTSEGIETNEQLAILRELGCDTGQGYLFARPVSAEEMSKSLRTSARPLARQPGNYLDHEVVYQLSPP